MNIAIDADVLGSGRGGDETYLRGLLAGIALAGDPSRDRFALFTRGRGARLPAEVTAHPSFDVNPLNAGRVRRYAFTLPASLLRARPSFDVLLTINHAPLLSPTPRALIVHDLSFLRHPEFYPRSTLLRLRALVPLHVRQSRVVITGSEFSRQDLIEAYRLPPESVVVVPPAIAPAPSPSESAPRLGRPYFLYVGNLHPRKNLAALVRAFRRALVSGLSDHQLVIAGASWWGDSSIGSLVATLPAETVRVVGRVTDAERDRLLGGATALVYPSLFEGIGLPPLEAMAMGTPVIASNAAALPETCGDAALLVDPGSEEAIAAALLLVASDERVRAGLRARGRERASQFTARAAGKRALSAFEQAIFGTGERRVVVAAVDD